MTPESGDSPRRPRQPPPPVGAGPPPSGRPAEPAAERAAPQGQDRPEKSQQADGAPQYTLYRSGSRLRSRRPDGEDVAAEVPGRGRAGGKGRPGWREKVTPKRVILGLIAFVVGWLVLSVVLFLLSATLMSSSPKGDVGAVLDSGGAAPFTATNVLVLGSDARQKGSKEPGANAAGSRSDTMMLIRTGGGHSSRLSIPRDTVVDIPGHGRQKINAAYAFGGAPLAITTVKHLLNVPINHVVEVNFGNFPQLVDAMGGVTIKTGCVISDINGGIANGGYTLRLKGGTSHIDGKQALALARTRHNNCHPGESDLTRERRQQALFNAMKSQLTKPTSFFRLPWISWDAPQALRSDMNGFSLLGLFASLAVNGTAKTKLLTPSGVTTLPDGEVGLSVSPGELHTAAQQFMNG